MTYILTNDDGIDAPGIAALRNAVIQYGIHDSVIVAPNAQLSGCSHQLTRGQSITIDRRSDTAIAIGGTPADCTRVAVSYLYPDTRFIFSGINAGGNLGSDIYVSGTVAAVREAALLRIPGIAFSQYIKRGQPIDWAIATRLSLQVLQMLVNSPWTEGTFWNVNLPVLAPESPEPDIVFCDPCTQPIPLDHDCDGSTFRYVGNYHLRPRTVGSDVEVCFSGNIAVTPLRLW